MTNYYNLDKFVMIGKLLQCLLFWYIDRWFILDNFYCDKQIMVVNQYYGYYYVCFKLCLFPYFFK